MGQNEFDQAARYAAKLDPPSFLRWLLPGLPPTLVFDRWLDARTLPFPGERDRTCDTVACLRNTLSSEKNWALVLEFQTEPALDILERLLEYQTRVRAELRPGPHGRERYLVAAVVVNLTGAAQSGQLEMWLPGEEIGLRLAVSVRALRDDRAADTLAAVSDGRLPRCLLPWVPLMQGGDDPAIIEQWKTLVATEPNERLRAEYAGLALVFAELTTYLAAWERALEDWDVRRSQHVMEWQSEVRRANVLRLLRLRFQSEPPADLAAAVHEMNDEDELSRWFDAAATAPSLDAFRNAVQKNGK